MHTAQNSVNGEGSLLVNGTGTLTINQLHIGRDSTGNGYFNLGADASVSFSHEMWFGRNGGSGVADIYGTIQSVAGGNRNFEIGQGAGSDGTATLHETGQLLDLRRFWIGANGGTGVFNLNGGTIVKTGDGGSILLGHNPGSDGTFSHNSGSMIVNNNLLIGNRGGIGVYDMAAGDLTVTGTGLGLVIGRTDGTNHGDGTFNLSGGITTSTPVHIGSGQSTGHLEITGGELQVSRIFGGTGTSSAIFDGGTITLTAASTVENQFMQGIGTATLGMNGLNVDANGFDMHLSQDFEGTGVITLANSNPTASTISFQGSHSDGSVAVENGIRLIANDLNLANLSFLGGDEVLLDIAGLLNIEGASLTLAVLGSYAGTSYVIANYGTLSGEFGSISGIDTSWTIDYEALNGTAISLIPEPTVALLGGLGLLALLRRRR